jgi:hypothetical protein
MPDRTLPEPFADLEPLAGSWALASEHDRYHKLHASSLGEVRAFYDAMLPRMPAILDYVDRYTVAQMPDDARTLFHLALTFAETAHPVDLGWKDVDFDSAYRWDKMEFRTVSR